MRVALSTGDLDGCAEHDVKFHKAILQSSGNGNLLRVWDALVFDVRIRISISKVSKDLPEVVESHQPIVDALRNGRAREASLLLRNHVETFAEYLKKSDSDSGVHRAFRKDMEGAKLGPEVFSGTSIRQGAQYLGMDTVNSPSQVGHELMC